MPRCRACVCEISASASSTSRSTRCVMRRSSSPASVRVTPFAAAAEEAAPQLLLEELDLAADRGLGDVQAAGGLGEGALLGHGAEHLELAEVHGSLEPIARFRCEASRDCAVEISAGGIARRQRCHFTHKGGDTQNEAAAASGGASRGRLQGVRRSARRRTRRYLASACLDSRNVTRAPKRTRRGPEPPRSVPSVPVTWPKVGVPKSRPGLAKCGVLVTLKASARSSSGDAPVHLDALDQRHVEVDVARPARPGVARHVAERVGRRARSRPTCRSTAGPARCRR